MKRNFRRGILLLLCLCLLLSPAFAARNTYMPDVTAEMSAPKYWSELQADPSAVLMTPEEIAAQNAANIAAPGTQMFDLKNLPETIDGVAQRDALQRSGKADADYYLGWTFQTDGSSADQAFYDAMVANMADPGALAEQPLRYAVAVNRTTLHTFPSDEQILDDPADPEFDYQHLTGVRVNEPLVIYAESADGAFLSRPLRLLPRLGSGGGRGSLRRQGGVACRVGLCAGGHARRLGYLHDRAVHRRAGGLPPPAHAGHDAAARGA